MASGFITLSDGRNASIRWTGYDLLLGLVVDALGEPADERAFRAFLQELIPPPDLPDGYEMGWGFIHPGKEECVVRILDLRSLTPQYHALFWTALQRAYTRIRLGAPHEGTPVFVEWVQDLLRTRRAIARGEKWSPQSPAPWPDERIGPGWNEATT